MIGPLKELTWKFFIVETESEAIMRSGCEIVVTFVTEKFLIVKIA